MKNIKFNAKNHIPILIGVTLLVLTLIGFYRKYQLEKCYRIFVGFPVEISGGPKTGYNLHFKFSKNNININNYDSIDKDEYFEKGGDEYYLKKHFFVKVSCTEENNISVIWDIPVPDTLKFVPANGWDKIPYGLDKK